MINVLNKNLNYYSFANKTNELTIKKDNNITISCDDKKTFYEIWDFYLKYKESRIERAVLKK